MTTIDIWNAKELPFGPLSNNAIFLMNIDKQSYNTVTNFIYSNLIGNKEYFNILKSINVKEIYDYFNKYDREIVNNLILIAMKRAYDEKIKNKEFEEILLTTENYPILYLNNDNILGTGSESRGQNLIGKYLMELRDNLNKKYNKLEKQLYESYLALQILQKLILEEDNDLSTFAGLNQKEIINRYIYLKAVKTAEKQKFDLSPYSYEQIIEKYRWVLDTISPSKNILELLKTTTANLKTVQLLEASLNYPYILNLYVKKEYYSNLRFSQLTKIKNNIFNIYVDNLLETKFPDLPKNKYEQAKNEELYNISNTELDILKEQIYNFFIEEILPLNVMKKIKDTVNLNVLTEKQVKNAQQFDIDYMVQSHIKPDEKLIITFEANSTPEQTPYFIFSPFLYTDMLIIDGLSYPSIMHYIIANLFSILPEVKTIVNAHKYLLLNQEGDQNDRLNYDDYEYLFYKYEDEKYYQFNRLRKKLATIAINKKFEDIGLQELLLATGNNELLWKDPYDDILGTGFNGGGENFIGRYLTELRINFFNKQEKTENILPTDISKITENDVFMRSWVEMRLKDICKVTNEIKDFIKKKTDKDVNIDMKFLMSVIDNIYQPCYDSIKEFDNITSSPPIYFRELVGKCFGFKNINGDMVNLLWNRIIVLIYFLLKYTPKLKNIKQVLSKIELIVSNKTKCVEILNNNEDNCIISAIVNILKKLVIFNTNNGFNPIITKYEVQTAVNIILNKSKIKLNTNNPDYNTFFNDELNVLNIGNLNLDEEVKEGEGEEVKEEYDIVFEDDDNESEKSYIDYPDEESEGEKEELDGGKSRWNDIKLNIAKDFEEKERKKFEIYKNKNKIRLFLDANNIISNNNDIIAEYIIDSVNTIKKFKMSPKIKTNRINFFATTV
jgi:predicted NAD-dependent protein-ADP-ribosyltransferase YbiA (DUF1768 family)